MPAYITWPGFYERTFRIAHILSLSEAIGGIMELPTSITVALDHTGVNFNLSMDGHSQRFFLRRDALPAAVDAPCCDNAMLKAVFIANNASILDAATRKTRLPDADIIVLSAADFAVALR